MSLIDKETEDAFRKELEDFINQKKSELEQIKNPEIRERFEKSMDRMRVQMEQLIQILQYNNEKKED
tara:strand:+ start:1829 stop:2029 length:201 start_codon:yes stop_codon:yes gene_type:complete